LKQTRWVRLFAQRTLCGVALLPFQEKFFACTTTDFTLGIQHNEW